MLDSIKELFATAPFLAWSVVGLLVAVVVIAAMWEKVRWWAMNTWMSFPVIGKIARLTKDTNRAAGYADWLKSERTLCMDYKQFVRLMSERDYNEKVEYLVLAGDNGRSHMPGWLWPIIMLMVFVEAMGFSYVLAGFTIPGASEHMQQMGAYGIAFLISGLLIFLTHFAGHELYRNSKINEARSEWQQAGRKFDLRSGTVPLSKPQDTDKEYPEYTRRINRIGSSTASYKMSIGTAIFVAVIAIGATYVRGQVLEKMLTEETAGQTKQLETKAASSDGLDMTDINLPAADSASDKAAQVKAINDGTGNERNGGWGTFIILAFIFAGLQALGVFFGFKWGFAGQNSTQAFRAIGSGKVGSYEEVLHYYDYVADVAQSKLEELQQRMMEYISREGTSNIQVGKHTFREFMQEEREAQARDRGHQLSQNRAENKSRNISTQPASAAQPAPVTAASVEAAAENTPLTLDSAMAHINSLASKDDKKSYISTLPASLQGEVMAALKAAKDEEKAKAAQLDVDLEELL